MTTPVYDQDAFRGRDDDVALNSATFNGGGALNTNWSQDVDVNFRVRFVVQETAGGKLNNGTFELWYSLNSGAYTAMDVTTPVQPADTTQYTNGATTTQVIGSGTYTTGDALAGVDNALDTGNVDLNGNDEVELEWCLTIDSAQVSNNDTIALRVYTTSGSALNVYTNTPTITAVESAGAQTISSAGAIASAEAFGTDKLNLELLPSAIASAEAFGTTMLKHLITGAGAIASAEAHGSPQLNLRMSLTGIPSAEAFGTLTLGLFIAGAGAIASAEAIGSHELREVQTISSTGAIASAEAFGSGQLNLTIFPAAIVSAEAFGSALMVLYLDATGIATAEAVGAHTLSQITAIVPTGIASAEAFGTSLMQLYLDAAGIASAEAVGSPGLVLFLDPAGIASAEAFGTTVLDNGGGLVISGAGGIDSAEAIGALLISLLSARPVRYNARIGTRTSRPRYNRPRRR